MADDGEHQMPDEPVITADLYPTVRDGTPNTERIPNRRVPDIMYDDRTIYRQEYVPAKPPYDYDLPWKAESSKRADRPVTGIVPGQNGHRYDDPYTLLSTEPGAGYNNTADTVRSRFTSPESVREGRPSVTGIPVPTMFLQEEPLEKRTEYTDRFGKTRADDSKLADITPVSQRRFKYHVTSGKFSFNCQHNNKCY